MQIHVGVTTPFSSKVQSVDLRVQKTPLFTFTVYESATISPAVPLTFVPDIKYDAKNWEEKSALGFKPPRMPISKEGSAPNTSLLVLVVTPSYGAKSVTELVQTARSAPGIGTVVKIKQWSKYWSNSV